jgi:hypothetical protein
MLLEDEARERERQLEVRAELRPGPGFAASLCRPAKAFVGVAATGPTRQPRAAPWAGAPGGWGWTPRGRGAGRPLPGAVLGQTSPCQRHQRARRATSRRRTRRWIRWRRRSGGRPAAGCLMRRQVRSWTAWGCVQVARARPQHGLRAGLRRKSALWLHAHGGHAQRGGLAAASLKELAHLRIARSRQSWQQRPRPGASAAGGDRQGGARRKPRFSKRLRLGLAVQPRLICGWRGGCLHSPPSRGQTNQAGHVWAASQVQVRAL